MARQPIRKQTIELLRPAAELGQNYVTPARSSLHDFADALGQLSGPLREFMEQRAAKAKEEDELRGEAAFYDENSDALAEMVRSGEVPSQYSPAFVRGFKRAQGDSAGLGLEAEFAAAYDAWGGKNSLDDPEAFDKFFAEWVKGKVGTDDPDVLRALLPHIRRLHDSATARHTQYQHEETYRGSLDAHVAGANQEIDAANADGLASETGTDYPSLFEKIAKRRAAFIATGGRSIDFDKTMIDAMSAKILSTRDPGLLAWFDQEIPGAGYSFGDSPYGQAVKQNTIEALEVVARRAESEEAQKQTAEDEKRKDAAWRAAVDILSKTPNAELPDGLLAEGSKYDPTFKVRVMEWRKALGTGFTDPDKLQAVYAEVLEGGGFAAVKRAADMGVFGRPEDLTAAYNFAKGFEDNKDRIGEVLGGATAKGYLDAFDVRTKGKTDLGDPISGMSNEGFEATYDFKRLVQEWVILHPQATPIETEEQVNKIGKMILDRITQADPSDVLQMEPGTYERDTQHFTNPFTDGTGVAPQPDEEPAEDTTQEPERKAELDDFLGGLDANQMAAMQEQAKRRGITVEQLAEEMLGGAVEDDTAGTPDAEPIAYSPGAGGRRGLGMAALVTSNKRGYSPDIKNLRPAVRNGVMELQEAWGQDLPIVSGFRGAKRNKKAGGAKHSQHKHGNAVDIDVSNLSTSEQVRLIRLASSQGFTGIGVYGGSLHLDYGGRRAWGPSHGSDSIPGWAKAAIEEHLAGTSTAPSGAPGKFDRETAMAFLDEALEENPLDLDFEGSARLPDAYASRLANLIKQHEAAGNYNAVYGNAGNKRDLSQFTLNQVLAMQVAARRRGGQSATGAYQFIYKTLRSLKRDLGLTGKERFTPQLQDRLFMALLERRGWSAFKAGKMSKRQFALGLSQEWASLPNPNTGRSYYKGQRATARPRQVYAALGFNV